MNARPPPRQSDRPPMEIEALERLALHYVARYATTAAKLSSYLTRKCLQRGATPEATAAIAQLVGKMAALKIIDDEAYAERQVAALTRRGYGPRRIDAALRNAGIAPATARESVSAQPHSAQDAVTTYLRRRRLGPFSSEAPSREAKQRVIAALLRAGHHYDDARAILHNWREPNGDH